MAVRRSRWLLLALLGVMMSLLYGCTGGGYQYSHYETVGSEGWKRSDTLRFTVNPVQHYGTYAEQLGLRTTSLYPFMQLMLIVSQEAQPSGFCRTDTMNVRLTDDDGLVTGEGISHYQYLFPLPPATLAAGDTLRVCVHHNMQRSPLAGITDVGFSLIFL
mgnify:FL=1